MPVPTERFATCFGVRHRTVDYYRSVPPEVMESVCPSDLLQGYPAEIAAEEFSRILGLKIGGLATLNPHMEAPQKSTAGRLLASLSSVAPFWEIPFPWINVQQSLTLAECYLPENNLHIADGFLMTFWLKDNNSVVCEFELR